MPTLTRYQKIVVRGTSYGSEIWQTGLHVIATTPPADQAALQADCDAAEPLVNDWWTAVKDNVLPGFKYVGISMYDYTAPSTVATFQAQTDRAPVAGSMSGGGSEIDTACVVSLRSPDPSRSGRNRMYVPCHQLVNAGTGMWDSTVPDDIAAGTKALFEALAGTPNLLPVVISRTHSRYQEPSKFITDNKPDVQRRRVNRLSPSYTSVLAFP